jgi:hypothetical protein
MSTDIIPIDCYQLSRTADTTALAVELAGFIKDNGLSTNIQNKEFVQVEGWQYAGSRLGIVPITRWTKDLTCEEGGKIIIRFEVRVELFDLRSQQVIGAGEAECDNTESGKKFYARYAIKSMAQTRAVGKAYRNCLAWIIKAAGYNPTPSEEFVTLPDACFEALTAADLPTLKEVVTNYRAAFGGNDAFRLACNARKAQLAPAEATPTNG